MVPCIIWCSACVAAVIFGALPQPSQGQGCSAEKTGNASVDLTVALSKGVRGADPIHVAFWEACVNICCVGKSLSANKKCNLVVFKTQQRGISPNCYLFHCPTEDACPLKQAAGLVTYRAIKESEFLKPTSSLNKSLDLTVNGSFASPKPVVLSTSGPTTFPVWLSPSQMSVASKMMKTTMKSIDKIRTHSYHLEGKGANPSERSHHLLTHQSVGSQASVNPPQNLIQPTVKDPAVTPSTQTNATATVPPSKATSTAHATADFGNTYMTTVSPRRSSLAPQPAAPTSQEKVGNLSPLPSRLSIKVLPAALQKARVSHGQLSGHSDSFDGAPSAKQALYLGDKSVLLAALLFGVIFLLLAHVVIGRKMLESLRHKRYSRLDYLINGMYANV